MMILSFSFLDFCQYRRLSSCDRYECLQARPPKHDELNTLVIGRPVIVWRAYPNYASSGDRRALTNCSQRVIPSPLANLWPHPHRILNGRSFGRFASERFGRPRTGRSLHGRLNSRRARELACRTSDFSRDMADGIWSPSTRESGR